MVDLWKVRLLIPYRGDVITLYAEDVDFTMVPLVCISGIRDQPLRGTIIIPPDTGKSELENMDPLLIPYTSIVFAGKMTDRGELLRFERKLILKKAEEEQYERRGHKAECACEVCAE